MALGGPQGISPFGEDIAVLAHPLPSAPAAAENGDAVDGATASAVQLPEVCVPSSAACLLCSTPCVFVRVPHEHALGLG
jgi:hypothetical protein